MDSLSFTEYVKQLSYEDIQARAEASLFDDSLASKGLAHIVMRLLTERADSLGKSRPGEQFQIKFGGAAHNDISVFGRDKETGIVVHSHGRDNLGANRNSLYDLRVALGDPGNTMRTHASICDCGGPGCRWAMKQEWEEEDDV